MVYVVREGASPQSLPFTPASLDFERIILTKRTLGRREWWLTPSLTGPGAHPLGRYKGSRRWAPYPPSPSEHGAGARNVAIMGSRGRQVRVAVTMRGAARSGGGLYVDLGAVQALDRTKIAWDERVLESDWCAKLKPGTGAVRGVFF